MIRFTRAAEADLDGIEAWIAPRAGGYVAKRVVETIPRGIETLDDFADIGRRGRVTGTRELGFAPRPMWQSTGFSNQDVIVSRILHGAMECRRTEAWERLTCA